jgi:hypothetical protein
MVAPFKKEGFVSRARGVVADAAFFKKRLLSPVGRAVA